MTQQEPPHLCPLEWQREYRRLHRVSEPPVLHRPSPPLERESPPRHRQEIPASQPHSTPQAKSALAALIAASLHSVHAHGSAPRVEQTRVLTKPQAQTNWHLVLRLGFWPEFQPMTVFVQPCLFKCLEQTTQFPRGRRARLRRSRIVATTPDSSNLLQLSSTQISQVQDQRQKSFPITGNSAADWPQLS